MSYGFFAKGLHNQVILDEENPTLRRAFKGEIRITNAHVRDRYTFDYQAPGFAYCEVTYPSVIRSAAPPVVVAAPTNLPIEGIGGFMPIGAPGGWTGFRVMCQIFSGGFDRRTGQDIQVGRHSGWEYHVCIHEEEEWTPGTGYGLRVFGPQKKIVFDSNWAITPFRGLLTDWRFHNNWNFYQHPGGHRIDWGYDGGFKDSRDYDGVSHNYRHSWGAANGTLGVVISGLCAVEVWGDGGARDRSARVPPMIRFEGSSRADITCTIDGGIFQHPSVDQRVMSRFALLTVDVSRT